MTRETGLTIVIVGGVAGGASAATRARRMNEAADHPAGEGSARLVRQLRFALLHRRRDP